MKWYATDHSFQVAHEAIQIHGAYGYRDEYDVERYLRNSRGAIIYEGTSEIHQLMQELGTRKDKPLCAANCLPMTRNFGRTSNTLDR
ncbi:MAG: acyl-CoA dehydrogenase family protein [Chloroflexota bacterium]